MRCAARVLLLLPFLLLPAPLAAQDGRAGPRSVLEGVFSKAQAKRGEEVFRDVCGACHSSSQFAGETFRLGWVGRTVRDLFRQIRNTMPNDSPGRLSGQEYIDVIAYILELNDYPTGEGELAPEEDALRRIRIELPGAR